ncbi:MAG TPA: RagB/SusD family nutrient uptake outer membrane protein [Membranihabitans sp.]|nr:RagB/SusD family nutrient uptake outer membrane protein [Membranihabitans sp.]
MNNIYNTLYFLTFLLIFTACESFLEIYPETALSSETFFKTEQDFEQAVNAAYAPLRSIANDRSWVLSELRSDNVYFGRNPNFGAREQDQDIADFALPVSDGITSNTHVLNQYRLDYQIISRTNQVLSTIDEVEFDPQAKNNLKGQALFLRSYAYFELVRYFSSVPLHLEPVTDRSQAAQPLASEEELYQLIIGDLTQAIDLLPLKSNQELGRATKGAAQTLLANIHIERQNWSAAETLLKQIVQSQEYGLMSNFEDVISSSTGNKNNLESIFEVQFKEGPDGMNGNFMYNIAPRPILASELVALTGTSNPQPLDGEARYVPTPDIIQAFEEGDLRKEVTIGFVEMQDVPWEEGYYPYAKKFFKHHSLHGNHGVNWPIYRYSEVLLFLAEALHEQGKSEEAAEYLTQVRARAGLGPATGDLGEAIFHERQVEFAFENKRWFDLVRTGRANQVMTAFGEKVWANPYDYYYPRGREPRPHAFKSGILLKYPLPAAESSLTPHF